MDLSTFKKFTDGFITGCISTVLFNPMDRALYLMVKDRKSFFDITVWKHPYLGVRRVLIELCIFFIFFFNCFIFSSGF